MRNSQTGKVVICKSGTYGIEEGAPQLRIAEQCVRACARYGFQRFTGNPYADSMSGKDPDDDVRPLIPAECLP